MVVIFSNFKEEKVIELRPFDLEYYKHRIKYVNKVFQADVDTISFFKTEHYNNEIEKELNKLNSKTKEWFLINYSL